MPPCAPPTRASASASPRRARHLRRGRIPLHELLPGIFALPERALWIPRERLLVAGDLHVGYESAHRDQGALLPAVQTRHLTERLEGLLTRLRPETVVLNGDLKHAFRSRSQEERGDVRTVCAAVQQRARLVVVEGNHDTGIASLLPEGAHLARTYAQGDLFFTHGHLPGLPPQGQVAVVSHEHPALSLPDAVGAPLRVPAFLADPRRGVVVLPAMSPWAAGVNMLTQRRFNGATLHGLDPADFVTVGVTADEVLPFGTIGEVRGAISGRTR